MTGTAAHAPTRGRVGVITGGLMTISGTAVVERFVDRFIEDEK